MRSYRQAKTNDEPIPFPSRGCIIRSRGGKGVLSCFHGTRCNPVWDVPPAPVEETPAVERTLTLPKTEFTVGEEIPVTATGSGTDWVGVYLKDEVPGGPASICWYYVAQDRDSGTAVDIRTQDCQRMDFDPMLPAGDYTVFLLADDGYDVVTSLDFTVVGEETVIEPAEEQGTEDQGVDEKLDAKAEAPNTFDFGVIAAVASLVSLGGFALTKKKH